MQLRKRKTGEELEEEEKQKLKGRKKERVTIVRQRVREAERKLVLSGQHQLCVSLSPQGSVLFYADANSLLHPGVRCGSVYVCVCVCSPSLFNTETQV